MLKVIPRMYKTAETGNRTKILYLTKTNVQLKPDISRTKKNKHTVKSTRTMKVYWLKQCILFTTSF